MSKTVTEEHPDTAMKMLRTKMHMPSGEEIVDFLIPSVSQASFSKVDLTSDRSVPPFHDVDNVEKAKSQSISGHKDSFSLIISLASPHPSPFKALKPHF